MRVAILGPLQVESDARPVEIGGARLRALLIRLAADPGRWVPIGALVNALWAEDPPSDQVNALQSLVSRLRRVLRQPGVIESGPAGYRLAVAPEAVDAVRFEQLIGEGRRRLAAGRAQEAASLLAEGLDLWRGEPVPEVIDAPYAAAWGQRLEEMRLSATEDRIEADLALGRHRSVIGELEQLTGQHPLRERAQGLLIRALSASGRPGDALGAYERLRVTLADELGLDPSPELQELQLAVLRGEATVRSPPPPRRTNLRTSLTSFVGRQPEITELQALLGRSRLVTLVGAGGAGKTRLAGETAAGLTEVGRDGVLMVELAPVSDPNDVASATLAVIGGGESTTMTPTRVTSRDALTRLVEGLAGHDVVLILDNCEHLVDAAATLAEYLLGRCPRLRVLATSREPLGIVGESLWPVRPLLAPEAEAGVQAALETPAVRLFADRAALVRPGFVVDAGNVAPITEICRRLDGLPLAIELAAARLRSMPVEAVAARLGDRFRLLTGGSRTAMPRHQTLRAVVAWSWDLLTESERRLAERMSVFPGGAGANSVEAVCARGALEVRDVVQADEVIDLLAALADKSLLVPVDGAGASAQPRYRMLETIREFSTEKLAERGEIVAMRAAHAKYFLALAETAEPQLRGPDQLIWLERLGVERDNLMAVLRYAMDVGDAVTGLRLGAALAWYWTLLGRHDEAASWLKQALDIPGDRPPGAYTIAWTVYTISAAASGLGMPDKDAPDEMLRLIKDLDLATEHPLLALVEPGVHVLRDDNDAAQEAIQRNLQHSDPWARAMLLMMTGVIAENDGDISALERSLPLALAEFRHIGDRWGIGTTLGSLASLQSQQGDLEAAISSLTEARRMMTELRARDDEAYSMLRIGMLRLRTGDLEGARRDMQAGRRIADETGAGASGAFSRISMGMLEYYCGDLVAARRLAEESLAAVERSTFLPPQIRAMVQSSLAMFDVAEGKAADARPRLVEAMAGVNASRDMPVAAVVATVTADLLLALGEPLASAQLLGVGTRLRGGLDKSDPEYDRISAPVRAELGPEAFEVALATGTDLDRAAAQALLASTIARLNED